MSITNKANQITTGVKQANTQLPQQVQQAQQPQQIAQQAQGQQSNTPTTPKLLPITTLVTRPANQSNSPGPANNNSPVIITGTGVQSSSGNAGQKAPILIRQQTSIQKPTTIASALGLNQQQQQPLQAPQVTVASSSTPSVESLIKVGKHQAPQLLQQQVSFRKNSKKELLKKKGRFDPKFLSFMKVV